MNALGFVESDANAPVSGAQMENLIGELGAMANSNPTKVRAIQKLKQRVNRGIIPTSNLTAKAEFESRLAMLPAGIVAELQAGKLQIVDKVIYTNKVIGTAQYAELMSNADTASGGVANINNRKLDANEYFMLTEIILLSGVNATLASTAFGLVVDNILNGEFQLTVGAKIIVPKTSCRIFNTTNRHDCLVGSYKLANPKLIPPQTEIKPEIWCAAANAANTNVAILLVGAAIAKN